MSRIVLIVMFVSMLAPDAGQPKRMCGRVVAVNCAGPLSPMSLRVARDSDRFFEVTMPFGSREALGADADNRYVDHTVCINADAVKRGKAVVNTLADLEVSPQPTATLPPLPAGVYGSCHPGIHPPEVKKDVPARYPDSALRARIEGRVEMRAVVNADGTVSNVVLVKRLFPDLDGAAVNALRQWLFSPATLEGTPVPIAVRLEMTFSLR